MNEEKCTAEMPRAGSSPASGARAAASLTPSQVDLEVLERMLRDKLPEPENFAVRVEARLARS